MLALFLTHPIDWLVNNGVGQNITASAIGIAGGVTWAHTKFWPLNALHSKLDKLHEQHQAIQASAASLHAKHDALTRNVAAMNQLHTQQVSALRTQLRNEQASKPAAPSS